MQGQFVQAASKQFLDLGYGLKKSALSLEDKYKSLITPSNLVGAISSEKTDLCVKDESILRKQINDIITQLQVSVNLINSILNVLNKLLVFLGIIRTGVTGLIALQEILKFLPIPSFGTTIGVPVKIGDILAKTTSQLQALYVIITGMDITVKFLAGFLGTIFTQLNNLISKLRISSQELQDCHPDLSNNLESNLNDLDSSIQKLDSKLGDLTKNENSYKGFTFQTIEEQTTSKVVAKRRYVVALNSNGIVTLQGPLSYATDTQVLIDELKLQIDNKNLTGYTT